MTEGKKITTLRIKVEVPLGTHSKYHGRCEKEFNSKRMGNIPLLKFITAYANYEIDIDDLDSLKFQPRK